MLKLVELTATRQGFGDRLAEGALSRETVETSLARVRRLRARIVP